MHAPAAPDTARERAAAHADPGARDAAAAVAGVVVGAARRAVRTLGRVGGAGAVAVLALVALEIVLRLTMGEFFEGRFEYGYRPMGGVRERGDVVTLVHGGARKFWPQQFTRAPAPGMVRIVTVGDSIPRGASLETSWPWLVAERLRADGVPAEGINLSIAGYGSARKRLLVDDALRWSPTVLVLQLGMSNEFEDERDRARADAFAGWHPRHWPMKSWLLRRLYEYKHERLFAHWLPPEVRARTSVDDAADEWLANQDPARVAAWRASFDANTAEALRRAREAGVPVILVPRVLAYADRTPASFDDEGLRERSASRLRPGEVAWFDPGSAFGPSPDPALFSRDRVHFHDPAHRMIADALAPRVLALLAERDATRPAVLDGGHAAVRDPGR